MTWYPLLFLLYGVGIAMSQHVTRRAPGRWTRVLCSLFWPALVLVVLFFIAHETFFPGAYEGDEDA